MLRLRKRVTPKIRYCGSLCQQNYGESLKGHGYTMWNLSDYSYTHNEIDNEYGYFTIEILNGNLVTNLDNIPKKVRLRVCSSNTLDSDIKSIIAQIKSAVDVIETSYIKIDNSDNNKSTKSNNIAISDLTNIDYQNILIKDYLQKKLNITDDSIITSILKINDENNKLIKKDDFIRNIKWRPIRFEFDNMFTYGEGNVINFDKMHGIYGIFGPNKSGKSSILSAFIFCLFDKFDRGFKGSHVLNVQKTNFRCKLQFEISGTMYFIERIGHLTKSSNVKVEVNFWRIVDGEKEELHGTDRKNTNDIIRDYIGSYEDFILTAASFQNTKNITSFIDIGNTERKDLLVQFIGLDIFDKLQKPALNKYKELQAILNQHKNKNYSDEINQYELSISHNNAIINEYTQSIQNIKNNISIINDELLLETTNLIKLHTDIPNNINDINSIKQSLELSIQNKQSKIENLKKSLETCQLDLNNINDSITDIEKLDLIKSHSIYKELNNNINNINNIIDVKKSEIKSKINKVNLLKNHKYDPNCQFCIDNKFVKDAMEAKEQLIVDKIESDKLLEKLKSYEDEFIQYKWVEKSYQEYTDLLNKSSKLKDNYSNYNKQLINENVELDKLMASKSNILNKIQLYEDNQNAVLNNINVQNKINELKLKLNNLNSEYNKINNFLINIISKTEVLKSQITTIKTKMTEISQLETDSYLFEQYLSAIDRNGIPYDVICNIVPKIEKEVNLILSQIVDYTVEFETDGKNVIPYVVYQHGKWPIELTSGYERFVASLAIRVALTNISNLPKISSLFIDEGWGCLDPDNMASMHTLLSTLKHNFDFIIIISHIDSMKDAVDHQLEITHDGTYAKIFLE